MNVTSRIKEKITVLKAGIHIIEPPLPYICMPCLRIIELDPTLDNLHGQLDNSNLEATSI